MFTNYLADKTQTNLENIRNDLLYYPQIISVCGSQSIPGQGRSGQFIYVAIISFIIAVLKISSQAIKPARMNPVDAIRHE